MALWAAFPVFEFAKEILVACAFVFNKLTIFTILLLALITLVHFFWFVDNLLAILVGTKFYSRIVDSLLPQKVMTISLFSLRRQLLIDLVIGLQNSLATLLWTCYIFHNIDLVNAMSMQARGAENVQAICQADHFWSTVLFADYALLVI